MADLTHENRPALIRLLRDGLNPTDLQDIADDFGERARARYRSGTKPW